MVASVGSGGIVYEALTEDNYENWNVLVKNYLKGKDLWDVVSGDEIMEDSEWKRKNAKALHAIQLSCGPDILNIIRNISSAREAWSFLSKYSPGFKGTPDTELALTGIGYNVLHRLVEMGNWNAVRSTITKNSDAVFEKSPSGKTVLHVAVIAGQEHIVEKLVNTLQTRLLEMRDNDGYTALALVAQLNGNTKMAKCMVEKNQALLIMKTKDQIPVLLASARGHKEMTRYLYSRTPVSALTENNSRYAVILLAQCIKAEIFCVALKLLQSQPNIPFTSLPAPEYRGPLQPLFALANMPYVFPSGCQLNWRQRIIYESKCWRKVTNSRCVKVLGQCLRRVQTIVQDSILLKFSTIREVHDKKLTHCLVLQIRNRLCDRVLNFDETQLRDALAYDAMLQAGKCGNIDFIDSMRKANPNLLWAIDRNKRGVFSHAILNRQEKVLKLLGQVEEQTKMITSREDAFGNNLLHLAAELGPSSDFGGKSGAALQMQKELQWFKEVEKIAHAKCKEARNSDGKKPHEVFTKSHGELLKEGAKWTKDTATSFTIVCTLIITIMFAAAFTVPGGNNSDTGLPIFLKRTLFEVYMVADAVSLVASSSSVLISIGILTSRYAEKDFHVMVPLKLLADLFFIFTSVVAMMVAFCVGIAMMIRGYRSVIIAAVTLACFPVFAFVFTQLPLFFEIFKSTIGLSMFTSVFKLPYYVFICIIKMIKGLLDSGGKYIGKVL